MLVKIDRSALRGAALLALLASCNLVQRPLPVYDPATAGAARAETDATSPAPSDDSMGVSAWEEWRGARVRDRKGERVGTVADVRVDLASGAIVGVEIAAPDAAPLLVPFDAFDWSRSDLGAGEVALRHAFAEVPGSAPDVAWYAERERARLTGVVEEPTNGTADDDAAKDALMVRLRDADNLVHRVLLRPAFLSPRLANGFATGTELRVEGVQARDETGKLLVAASATWNGSTLRLRGADGAVLWDELDAGYADADAWMERGLARADGGEHEVIGWRFDREDGRVVGVTISFDHAPLVVPWDEIAWSDDRGTWTSPRQVAPEPSEGDDATGAGEAGATEDPAPSGAQPEDASAPAGDGGDVTTPEAAGDAGGDAPVDPPADHSGGDDPGDESGAAGPDGARGRR